MVHVISVEIESGLAKLIYTDNFHYVIILTVLSGDFVYGGVILLNELFTRFET